jgi:threonine dehydrogenase-like Zn-dependent dehydrogenase
MALVESAVLHAADLVTHQYPLEQVVEAYAMAQRPESLKVIVTFQQ